MSNKIVEIARTWKDTPFRWHQRLKGEGVDCLGLIVEVGKEAGLLASDFDYQSYGNNPQDVPALVGQYLQPAEGLEPGRVVVLNMNVSTWHIGIVGQDEDGLTLIHSSYRRGVTEHPLDSRWEALIDSIYSY